MSIPTRGGNKPVLASQTSSNTANIAQNQSFNASNMEADNIKLSSNVSANMRFNNPNIVADNSNVGSNNVNEAENSSFSDKFNENLAKIQGKSAKKLKKNDILKKLNIPDSAFNIPIESLPVPHLVALIAAIAVPLVMLCSLIMADGILGLLSFNLIILIAILAILWGVERFTANLGRILVGNVENSANGEIAISEERDHNEHAQQLIVRIKPGNTVKFTYFTRADWDSMIDNPQEGVLVVGENRKAAIV